MYSYIKADLRRIFRRTPRWILLAIVWIISAISCVVGKNLTFYDSVGIIMSNFSMFILFYGVIEMIYIYGDDFKAKTMQIAIGTGIPRQKIVHAKWLEFMIAAAIDLAAGAALSLLTSAIWIGTEGGFSVGKFILEFVMAWLAVNATLGWVMFIMFWMQGISLAMIVFILVATNIDEMAIGAISKVFKLTKLHLQTYTLGSLMNDLTSRIVMGHFSWHCAIGILIYMMIGFALASAIFKKKELEF